MDKQIPIYFRAFEPRVTAKISIDNRKNAAAGGGIRQELTQLKTDFSNAMAVLIVTGESTFDQLWRAFKIRFVQRVIDEGIDKIFDAISGKSGSGGGGILSGIGKVFGSIFGGGKAEGGRVQRGRAFLVGERGPEPFIPDVAGTILPNRAMAGLGGGMVINNVQNFNFALGVSETVRAEVLNMAPAIAELSVAKVAEVIGGGGSAARRLGG